MFSSWKEWNPHLVDTSIVRKLDILTVKRHYIRLTCKARRHPCKPPRRDADAPTAAPGMLHTMAKTYGVPTKNKTTKSIVNGLVFKLHPDKMQREHTPTEMAEWSYLLDLKKNPKKYDTTNPE